MHNKHPEQKIHIIKLLGKNIHVFYYRNRKEIEYHESLVR